MSLENSVTSLQRIITEIQVPISINETPAINQAATLVGQDWTFEFFPSNFDNTAGRQYLNRLNEKFGSGFFRTSRFDMENLAEAQELVTRTIRQMTHSSAENFNINTISTQGINPNERVTVWIFIRDIYEFK